jgi:GMP synthase (glutamine-hydrolysing)
MSVKNLPKNAFNPEAFIDDQVESIRRVIDGDRAIIACSGGVDSTTCAVLTHMAIGDRLLCVFIDTNFMRLGEPERVVQILSSPPLGLPVRLIRAKSSFMEALSGLEDAEEKRKAFRSTFYRVLSDAAREEGCRYLVQGTILADVIETVGGIKTQHNVLEQMKIDSMQEYGFRVVEPLVSLYKHQVREVAKALKVPDTVVERQPFPGPGLSIRVLGRVTAEKLDVEKNATEIVEALLEPFRPKQYFAATIDYASRSYQMEAEAKKAIQALVGRGLDVRVESLEAKATGIRGGRRLYGRILLVTVRNSKGRCAALGHNVLNRVQSALTSLDGEAARVLYSLTDRPRGRHLIVAIRAVESKDFIEASVTKVPWRVLREVEAKIVSSCPPVSAVYFDITPKPPGSIEFE